MWLLSTSDQQKNIYLKREKKIVEDHLGFRICKEYSSLFLMVQLPLGKYSQRAIFHSVLNPFWDSKPVVFWYYLPPNPLSTMYSSIREFFFQVPPPRTSVNYAYISMSYQPALEYSKVDIFCCINTQFFLKTLWIHTSFELLVCENF